MCCSAQIWADYRKYVRAYGADVDSFTEHFWSSLDDDRLRLPKAMEEAFLDLPANEGQQIRNAIGQYRLQQASQLEQLLPRQRQRPVDAGRTLQRETTKAAPEARRIASAKIDWALGRPADLQRTEPQAADSGLYPGHCAPVMVMENGRRMIKAMRHRCRPVGQPALNDAKFPGTCNACRDKLEGFWKGPFGHTHALMLVNAFHEHVAIPNAAGDTEKRILAFKPRPTQDLLVVCLWSPWTATGEPDLLSFAAITDEPPAEVAAAGHDRCIIPIKPEHIDAWLNPGARDCKALFAILETASGRTTNTGWLPAAVFWSGLPEPSWRTADWTRSGLPEHIAQAMAGPARSRGQAERRQKKTRPGQGPGRKHRLMACQGGNAGRRQFATA